MQYDIIRQIPDKPWLSIWLQPRRTVRAILDYDPEYLVRRLAVISGALSGMSTVLNLDTSLIGAGLLVGAVVGGLIGILTLYITAAISTWVGGRLGGRGTSLPMRTAVAWAGITGWPIPFFNITVLLAPQISPVIDAFLALGLLVLTLVLSFLSLGILAGAIAEVHQFSNWRGLATLLIPGVVVFVAGLLCIGPLLISG